ncbi:hypothetical protein AC249_AIPGENE21576 [Exaiptasia diaphana]|nr:hypothetical protein AC249_AIPGENE21576 [Exaiptasia diaphana]
MPPKDYRAKKSFKVVSFKGGKVSKKANRTLHARYSSLHGTREKTNPRFLQHAEHHEELMGGSIPDIRPSKRKPGFIGINLKKRIIQYHQRKANLANSWRVLREDIITTLVDEAALKIDQQCVAPGCPEHAVGRCVDCGPSTYLCKNHMDFVHAGGRSLHKTEKWKEGRYINYQLPGSAIWTTVHNQSHGYVRDIVVIDVHGQQHAIKMKCCEHESEALTIIRFGFWPSTPKQPKVAFDMQFMKLLQCIFLECRVSLNSGYLRLGYNPSNPPCEVF